MSRMTKVTQEELISYRSVLKFAADDLEKLVALYPTVQEMETKNAAAMARAVRAVDNFVSGLKATMPQEARKSVKK